MVGPAKQALSYGLLIYGSESGYLSSRAQIELNGPGPLLQNPVAFVRFCDPGVTFPLDNYDNGIVTMYLPTAMLGPVLDILRTEKLVEVYFGPAQGFISAGNLLVGGGPTARIASATRKGKKGRTSSKRRAR
jgi:hypothetical protein